MAIHKTVLLKEAVDSLKLGEGDVVIDATLGGGGHSLEILKKIGKNGKLIAFDRDERAIESFKIRIKKNKQVVEVGKNLILVNENFSNLKEALNNLQIKKVDAVLADFGLSSDQLDDKDRGFSFQKEANLDMRMNEQQELTAKEIVNEYSEEELKEILYKYGEEQHTKKIVEKIVIKRDEEEIKTTTDLVEIILEAVPGVYKRQKIHPATKTFQALRIEVNQELKSIEKFLKEAVNVLQKKGRLAVISFHSGEDRLVKNIFKDLEKDCACPSEFPVCVCSKKQKIKIITRRPLLASEEEIKKNPRARSAKMRIAEAC